MKKHKKADAGRQSQKQNFHQEDLALKTAAQFFGGELLPLLGVKGVIKYIAPIPLPPRICGVSVNTKRR